MTSRSRECTSARTTAMATFRCATSRSGTTGSKTSDTKGSTRSPCGQATIESITMSFVAPARTASKASNSSQYSGIKNNAGTVKIYNNWVEATGQHGIQVWTQEGPKESEGKGPFEAHIWNNVVVDAGKLWRSFMGSSYGISVGAQAGCEKPVPFIYNNTIVNSRQSAINVSGNVGAGFVRDNIVAGRAAIRSSGAQVSWSS